MELRRLKTSYQGKDFEICEEIFYSEPSQVEKHAYLYVEKDGKGLNDYLLMDVNKAKIQAYREYNVPFETWKELDPIKEEP